MSGPRLDKDTNLLRKVASMNGDMKDVVQTVEAALAKIDAQDEAIYAHHALSVYQDDDGNDAHVEVTWDQIRALVARCRAAEVYNVTLDAQIDKKMQDHPDQNPGDELIATRDGRDKAEARNVALEQERIRLRAIIIDNDLAASLERPTEDAQKGSV